MLIKPLKKVYDFLSRKATSPKASLWLGAAFLCEIILFIPLDALLIVFCLEKRHSSVLLAILAAVASTISGMIGYLLGLWIWNTVGISLIHTLLSPQAFQSLVDKYQAYEGWAIFLGAFLPLPFKAIALSAGFCKLSFGLFVFYVLIARLVRFLSIACVVSLMRDRVKSFIDTYFGRIAIALWLKIAIGLTWFFAWGT